MQDNTHSRASSLNSKELNIRTIADSSNGKNLAASSLMSPALSPPDEGSLNYETEQQPALPIITSILKSILLYISGKRLMPNLRVTTTQLDYIPSPRSPLPILSLRNSITSSFLKYGIGGDGMIELYGLNGVDYLCNAGSLH